MLFLINKSQKKKILDAYQSSLINLFTIGLLVLSVLFVVVLFPTYLAMRVDRQILTDKIQPLKGEIEKYKSDNSQNESLKVNNDISILSVPRIENTLTIYKEVQSIYGEIPNVEITSIQVDTLSKKVSVNAIIDNKNTANRLVDRLNTSRYKGAVLPYSVFSQGRNFIFNQILSYE